MLVDNISTFQQDGDIFIVGLLGIMFNTQLPVPQQPQHQQPVLQHRQLPQARPQRALARHQVHRVHRVHQLLFTNESFK